MVLRELNKFKSYTVCRILKHENGSQLQPWKHEPAITLLINENIFPNNNLFIACSSTMCCNNVYIKPRNNPQTWIDTLCSWPEGPSCQSIIHMMAIQRDYNLAQFSSTPF